MRLALVETALQHFPHLLATEACLADTAHSRDHSRLALQNGQDGVAAGEDGLRSLLEVQQYSLQFLQHTSGLSYRRQTRLKPRTRF